MRRRMRNMKKRAILFFLISLFLVVAGCGTYGKLRLEGGPGETMTTQRLKENWDKFHVLATGVEPNVPSAILFDRKDDGRKVIGERWWELKDPKAIAETVGRIEAQDSVAQFYPRLWKILGPDEHLYGYMLTAWDHAVMSIGDDRTMRVLDLPVPPFMAVNGDSRVIEPR
jgi:hypothetical protein